MTNITWLNCKHFIHYICIGELADSHNRLIIILYVSDTTRTLCKDRNTLFERQGRNSLYASSIGFWGQVLLNTKLYIILICAYTKRYIQLGLHVDNTTRPQYSIWYYTITWNRCNDLIDKALRICASSSFISKHIVKVYRI